MALSTGPDTSSQNVVNSFTNMYLQQVIQFKIIRVVYMYISMIGSLQESVLFQNGSVKIPGGTERMNLYSAKIKSIQGIVFMPE